MDAIEEQAIQNTTEQIQEIEFLKKPSATIQINSTQISMIQRKAWSFLLINAARELKTKTRYTISINDLSRIMKYKDTEQLKESLKKLLGATIEFNILRSKDKSAWEAMSLLGYATVENNILTYGYIEELRKRLVDRPIYTLINIVYMMAMSSKYALILYELSCDWMMEKTFEGKSEDIPVATLKKILGCEDSGPYSDFRYFNRDILKKAVDEVNKKSDMKIRVVLKRTNKRVTAVQFYVEKKERLALLKSLQDIKTKIPPADTTSTLMERLVITHQVAEEQAQKYINEYGEDHLIERLDWVNQNYLKKNKKPDSLAGITVWAITTKNLQCLPVPAEEKPPKNLPKIHEGMKIDMGTKGIGEVDCALHISTGRNTGYTEMEIREKIDSGEFRVIGA